MNEEQSTTEMIQELRLFALDGFIAGRFTLEQFDALFMIAGRFTLEQFDALFMVASCLERMQEVQAEIESLSTRPMIED